MTTIYVNVAEAKAKLSYYIQQALNGNHVILSKHNKPLVEINPIKSLKKTSRRKFGLADGKYEFSDDLFDPISEEDWENAGDPLNGLG